MPLGLSFAVWPVPQVGGGTHEPFGPGAWPEFAHTQVKPLPPAFGCAVWSGPQAGGGTGVVQLPFTGNPPPFEHRHVKPPPGFVRANWPAGHPGGATQLYMPLVST